jgi:hypothetical protein
MLILNDLQKFIRANFGVSGNFVPNFEKQDLWQICHIHPVFRLSWRRTDSGLSEKEKSPQTQGDVQDLLLKAGTLADNAITSAKKNEHQEAIQMLAVATQHQNSALENLCSTIDKLHKALQKLED